MRNVTRWPTLLALLSIVVVAQAVSAADQAAQDALVDKLIATANPPAAAATGDQPRTPSQLALGQTVAYGAVARNRAAVLTVHSESLLASYGSLLQPSAPGRAWLVLDTTWENLIPLQIAREKALATEYRIPNLADHLYVVVDGVRCARIVDNAGDLAGHVPVKDFSLDRVGARIRGNIVLDVPVSPKTLELRFYDYAHGHITVPLLTTGAVLPDDKPVSPPQQNDVVEIAAYELARSPKHADRAVPAGLEFVSVDLRARSRYMLDSDATAFDPKAKAGARMQMGTVADWTEAHRYMQLVVDGQYSYTPEPTPHTQLSDAPRFLPDVMTGDRVVFLAPAGAASVELRCEFPNARKPDGTVFHPADLVIPLSDKTPALAPLKPLVKIEDDIFVVSITGQAVAGEFAGHAAEAGRRMLVLDVTVQNRGQKGEFFQTVEQMKYTDAAGQQSAMDQASGAGLYRPPPLLWVPAGERRSFQAVYQIDQGETTPRLAYSGVSKAEMVPLPTLASAPQATVVAPAPDETPPSAEPVPAPEAMPTPAPEAEVASPPAPVATPAPAPPPMPAAASPAPEPAPPPSAAPAPPPAKRFCTACGKELISGAKFCRSCGAKVR